MPGVLTISLVKALKHIVLPAPLTPYNAKHSPLSNSKVAFLTVTILPFCIVKSASVNTVD
jgi:hypothetical protein